MAKLIVSGTLTVILLTCTIVSTYWLVNYGPEYHTGQPYPFVILPMLSGICTIGSGLFLFASAEEYDRKRK